MRSCRRRPLKVRPSLLFRRVWFVMLISHGFNLGCPCRLSDGVDAPWSSLSTLVFKMVIGGNQDLFLRLVPSRVGIFGRILNDAEMLFFADSVSLASLPLIGDHSPGMLGSPSRLQTAPLLHFVAINAASSGSASSLGEGRVNTIWLTECCQPVC